MVEHNLFSIIRNVIILDILYSDFELIIANKLPSINMIIKESEVLSYLKKPSIRQNNQLLGEKIE